MSTNYYLRRTCDQPCPHCNVSSLHLGQYAGGWQFAFQADREAGVTDYDSWLKQLDGHVVITDEYDRQLTRDEMLAIVDEARTRQPRGLYGNDWYDTDGNYFSASEFS